MSSRPRRRVPLTLESFATVAVREGLREIFDLRPSELRHVEVEQKANSPVWLPRKGYWKFTFTIVVKGPQALWEKIELVAYISEADPGIYMAVAIVLSDLSGAIIVSRFPKDGTNSITRKRDFKTLKSSMHSS